MKTIRMILASSLLAGVVIAGGACKKSASEEARDKVEDRQEEVAEQREDVRDEQKDVADEMKDVTEERRDVAEEASSLDRMEADLAAAKAELQRAYNERIAKIDAKIAELEAKGDAKSRELAAEFRVRRDEARSSLNRVGEQTKAGWLSFKEDVSTRWDRLERDVDAAL